MYEPVPLAEMLARKALEIGSGIRPLIPSADALAAVYRCRPCPANAKGRRVYYSPKCWHERRLKSVLEFHASGRSRRLTREGPRGAAGPPDGRRRKRPTGWRRSRRKRAG